jgi:ADP-heptose:LPS heptosyltransferase
VLRYLEVVGLVGAAPVSLTPAFPVTAADRAAAARAVGVAARAAGAAGAAAAPWVVLHPGATDPRRRWPPERFAAVGNALRPPGARSR